MLPLVKHSKFFNLLYGIRKRLVPLSVFVVRIRFDSLSSLSEQGPIKALMNLE